MPQKLPTALAQIKASSTTEKLLNEIIYSFFRAKEITKKVYTTVMCSIKF